MGTAEGWSIEQLAWGGAWSAERGEVNNTTRITRGSDLKRGHESKDVVPGDEIMKVLQATAACKLASAAVVAETIA